MIIKESLTEAAEACLASRDLPPIVAMQLPGPCDSLVCFLSLPGEKLLAFLSHSVTSVL